jgi:hypothetical protein
MEILQLLCSRYYCLANILQMNCQLDYSTISSQTSLQNSTELILSLSLSLMLRPTVSRPVCLGIKHPDFYCRTEYGIRRTVAGLLIGGTLSDERMGLSFTIASGPSQRSHSQVRVPWDSRPYLLSQISDFFCLS